MLITDSKRKDKDLATKEPTAIDESTSDSSELKKRNDEFLRKKKRKNSLNWYVSEKFYKFLLIIGSIGVGVGVDTIVSGCPINSDFVLYSIMPIVLGAFGAFKLKNFYDDVGMDFWKETEDVFRGDP